MSTKSTFASNKAKRGFTLIELLVVIAIIGLLASIVAVAVNKTRLKARNTRRNADIRTLVNAFNMVLDVNGSSLPSLVGPGFGPPYFVCVSSACAGGWTTYGSNATDVANVKSALAPYLPKLPSDPSGGTRTSSGYLYTDYWAAGTAPYDSSTFPAGSYIDYLMEEVTPIPSDVCGPGRIWSTSTTDHYIQCFVKLD